jgi:hypothetical protein
MTLTEFLLARIAEDEVAAQVANDHDRWAVGDDDNGDTFVVETDVTGLNWRVALVASASVAEHMALHDPLRVLAECEAKRQIIVWHQQYNPTGCGGEENHGREDQCPTLQALALPYASHPDYREEWQL